MTKRVEEVWAALKTKTRPTYSRIKDDVGVPEEHDIDEQKLCASSTICGQQNLSLDPGDLNAQCRPLLQKLVDNRPRVRQAGVCSIQASTAQSLKTSLQKM